MPWLLRNSWSATSVDEVSSRNVEMPRICRTIQRRLKTQHHGLALFEPHVDATTLELATRKPFDVLAEGLISEKNRGSRI